MMAGGKRCLEVWFWTGIRRPIRMDHCFCELEMISRPIPSMYIVYLPTFG